MFTRICAHTTTTEEKKRKNEEGDFNALGHALKQIEKGESAATHRMTQTHTQISSLEATGRTRF